MFPLSIIRTYNKNLVLSVAHKIHALHKHEFLNTKMLSKILFLCNFFTFSHKYFTHWKILWVFKRMTIEEIRQMLRNFIFLSRNLYHYHHANVSSIIKVLSTGVRISVKVCTSLGVWHRWLAIDLSLSTLDQTLCTLKG